MVEQILKRLAKLESSKQIWSEHWQEILDYVMPRKAEVTTQYARGAKRTSKLYDSTDSFQYITSGIITGNANISILTLVSFKGDGRKSKPTKRCICMVRGLP